MNSKLPNQLTLEELLESLEDDNTIESLPEEDYSDSTLRFISMYDIEGGDKPIASSVLYKLYKNSVDDPVSHMAFGRRINLYIESKHGFYLINRDAMKLGEILHKILKNKTRNYLKSKNYKHSYDLFLLKNNIKPGKFFVESFVLHYMYDEWRFKNQSNIIISPKAFADFTKMYFIKKRLTTSKLGWFGIDRELVKHYLTDEKLQHIRTWYAKQQARKKNYKKGSKKVPGVRPKDEFKESSGSN